MANPKTELEQIESAFRKQDYVIRYEKGNFSSGYCIVKDRKIIIINKFYKVPARLQCLREIQNRGQIALPLAS